MKPDSEAGRYFQKAIKDFEKIENLFAEAVNNAIESGRGGTAEDTDIRFSERNTYSYKELTSKPDMKLTTVDTTKVLSRADTIAEAKKNAAKVGTRHNDGSVSVKVNDTGKEVLLTNSGLSHSLYRNLRIISPITIKAGDILKNSIKINEFIPKKQNVAKSYALIGAAADNSNTYIVRFIVNSFSDEIESLDV